MNLNTQVNELLIENRKLKENLDYITLILLRELEGGMVSNYDIEKIVQILDNYKIHNEFYSVFESI
jgi:hypothetical protein